MRIFKTRKGIVLEREGEFRLLRYNNWDDLINDGRLYPTCKKEFSSLEKTGISEDDMLAPIGLQELWACGVTYLRSKIGRQEESKDAGGGDFYAKVYEAERPELFFKSTAHRVVGHKGKVRIRKDSSWNVPEPELTLVVNSGGKIVGYTIGNDMSSRSIEGENPLYLPQAKTYDGCAALGPGIYLTDKLVEKDTGIQIIINRQSAIVFEGAITVGQMKRTPEELVSWVFRECSFPHGCLIMTGTGIVPPPDFTLRSGDEISIKIDRVGELVNQVE